LSELEWASLAFMLAGLLLFLLSWVVVIWVALIALRPRSWQTRYANTPFISYAWNEFGRSILIGFFTSTGFSPLTVFVFGGQPDFWANFWSFSAVLWAASTITSFLTLLVAGFLGYARVRFFTDRSPAYFTMGIQAGIVSLFMAPLIFVLVQFLIAPLYVVVRLLWITWVDFLSIYF